MQAPSPDMFLVICSFFYKHNCLQEYAASMVGTAMILERLGIKYDYWSVAGNFHMDYVVNSNIQKFLDHPEATDLLIIDVDESWNPQHLVRLLLHEEECVCGVYLQTNREPTMRKYPVLLKTDEEGHHLGKMLPDKNCLLKADKMPSGFLRIKKTALEKFVKAYPDDWYWSDEKKVHIFFQNEVRDHVFHGMDFVFTEKLKACGVDLWVDPICDISHWGPMEYRGTLDEYLRALKIMQDNKESFDIVSQMAKEVADRAVKPA